MSLSEDISDRRLFMLSGMAFMIIGGWLLFTLTYCGTRETREYYVGLTDNQFKIRLANHKQSFGKSNLKNSTELSKYVWSLKSRNIEHSITWKVIGRATAYNNKTKKCNLCTLEKYFIICHPDKATLNQKCGIVTNCRHASKFILANHPT